MEETKQKTCNFLNGNQKALRLLNKYKNVIFSYLNADPEKGMNRISTIPVNKRTEENGFANFAFYVNVREDKRSYVRKYNVRFETGLFNDTFSIQTSKVHNIEKAHLLIFANDSRIYISESDPDLGRIKWLRETKFFSQKTVDWLGNGSLKTYNEYNIYGLLNNHQIVSLAYDFNTNGDTIKVITSTDFMVTGNKDTRTIKPYYDYNIDTSHITKVQFDLKVGKVMYFSLGDRYTNNIGSSSIIALRLSEITTLTQQQLYQRILRVYNKMVKTGKAYCTKFPVKPEYIGHFGIDQRWLDSNGNISLYVSYDEHFDIIENKVELATADMKEYQKEYREKTADSKKLYQKVFMYLKRHNNTFNPKWNENEVEIARTILTTRSPSPKGEGLLLVTEGE